MNDRDFANDALATEKYMTAAYSTALNEMSHDMLYRDIKTVFNETQDCQRNLFNLMYQKGWYSLKASDPQQLQQDYQKFSNEKTQQFPNPGNLMQ
ncbi:MAG TPA: spore coat protein [Bacillales bacterium]|nr:spore coat protein [Bacillales bacterium]